MKYFFIECQSNTLPLMNIIISDISKLATKTPEQPFINFEQNSTQFQRIKITVGELLIYILLNKTVQLISTPMYFILSTRSRHRFIPQNCPIVKLSYCPAKFIKLSPCPPPPYYNRRGKRVETMLYLRHLSETLSC